MTTLDLLLGVPEALIRAAYGAAPGNEIVSGKFASKESSAALVANTFGFFLQSPATLPLFPGRADWGWPPISLALEAIVRFPWSGGRHPCLDVLITTTTTLVGVESKRYEPFRPKPEPDLSEAYWRPVWGERMEGFMAMRDALRDGALSFGHLDATQLVKHAFGLRTAVGPNKAFACKRAILLYLYAEPSAWPDGRPIPPADIEMHQKEIAEFSRRVRGDEVQFATCSYGDLLSIWSTNPNEAIRAHAAAVKARFEV